MKKTTKKIKFLNQKQFFVLYNKFLNQSYKGIRVKNNGQRIRSRSIDNQFYTKKLIYEFSLLNKIEIKLFLINHLTEKEILEARIHWQKFYLLFTDFLFYEKNYYDNYVGLHIINLRTFMNYLSTHEQIQVGSFHRQFYVPKEEIPIIVISPSKLNYLINDFALHIKLSEELRKIKDLFIFGCAVALRVSDLLALKKHNLMILEGVYYLRVIAKKTGTITMVKLPPFALDILQRHQSKNDFLLPQITIAHFNRKLKILARYICTDEPMIKIRFKKGKPETIYKDLVTKNHYTLADHITTHTMRRTAITNMLRFGMPEQIVRKISGHAANSKEFFKYVSFSQSLIDTEIDKVFEKLANYR